MIVVVNSRNSEANIVKAVFFCIAALIFAPFPCRADGPFILDFPGKSHDFPTWGFGAKTTLCIKSLNHEHDGKVRINVGAAQEDLDTNNKSGNAVCIQRDWQTMKARVTNITDIQKPISLEVWTY